ncbi:MAG: SpoVG family protein [Oscillospiraceae bacterium]|nr:SpoVG family protein [Oscillospiraceae bacterium]
MVITDVKIHTVLNNSRIIAYASVVIDDWLMIRDLKLVQGNNRLFVAMPSRKLAEGGFADMVHPIFEDVRESIELSVFNAYYDFLADEYSTM